MIRIREAETTDVPAISDLYRQLVHPVAPETEINIRADQIKAIRAHPHNFLFVLETGRQVCGTAFVTLCLDPMHGNQPYALLEHFVIDRSYRGRGHGATLARYVENFCHQANCSRIMFLSNSKRSDAHAFFEKQGFCSHVKKGFVKYRADLRATVNACINL